MAHFRYRLALLLVLISASTAQAQSPDGECGYAPCNFLSSTAGPLYEPVVSVWASAFPQTKAGQHNWFSLKAGQTYEWSLCAADGAVNPTPDAMLTLIHYPDVPICGSNNVCGLSPKIRWTSPVDTQVRVRIMQNGCITNNNNHTLRYRCVSCPEELFVCDVPPVVLPCSSNPPFTAVNLAPGTGTMTQAGFNCPTSAPGRERMLQFTSSTVGMHQLVFEGLESPVLCRFLLDYKIPYWTCEYNESLPEFPGLPPHPDLPPWSMTGWSCVAVVGLSASDTIISVPLPQGYTYSIMLDAVNPALGANFNFKVVCPSIPNPCVFAEPTEGCNQMTEVLFYGGTGSFPNVGCGSHPPGPEKAYTFTPTVSGMHVLYQTLDAGRFNYYYRPVSSGCGPTGWTCIGDLTGNASAQFYMEAGEPYYILVDAHSVDPIYARFMVQCATPQQPNDDCANAIQVNGFPYTSPLINITSAVTDGPATPCDGPYRNLWWKVTGACGPMTVTTCGSTVISGLAVFTGNCGALSHVDCDDDGAACAAIASELTWTATQGTTYYITAGTNSITAPGFDLKINVTANDTDNDGVGNSCDNCPTVPGVIGTPCNDGNPNTMNDVLVTGCTCAGTPIPNDCTGVPGGPTQPGSPCNDNNACTTNDAYNMSCQCTGTVVDADSDGICDLLDACPTDPNKVDPGHCGCGNPDPSTPCDDGDPMTVDDKYWSDCLCYGLPDKVQLQVKVRLEGPYDSGSGLMYADLRLLSDFPMVEPYTALGYTHVNGGNEFVSHTLLSVWGDDAIVDWIVLEVRDPDDPSIVLASRSALVQSDGDVVDGNGNSAIWLDTSPGLYYVSVRHRNHLGAMLLYPRPLTPFMTYVDFSENTLPTWGTEARNTTGPVALLWSGDVNFDGDLRYTGTGNDRDPILVEIGGTTPNTVVTKYHGTDVNMDAAIKYTGTANDRDRILINIGGTTPNAVRTEQIP